MTSVLFILLTFGINILFYSILPSVHFPWQRGRKLECLEQRSRQEHLFYSIHYILNLSSTRVWNLSGNPNSTRSTFFSSALKQLHHHTDFLQPQQGERTGASSQSSDPPASRTRISWLTTSHYLSATHPTCHSGSADGTPRESNVPVCLNGGRWPLTSPPPGIFQSEQITAGLPAPGSLNRVLIILTWCLCVISM